MSIISHGIMIWREMRGMRVDYRVTVMIRRGIGFLRDRLLWLRDRLGTSPLSRRLLGLRLAVERNFFRLVWPVNRLLICLFRRRVYPNSVLHISFMVHIPYYMTRILREKGMKADYLAVGGKSPWWDKYDYFVSLPQVPWMEWLFFWRVVSRYEAVHSHFGILLSETGWELPLLRQLGRRLIVHYRGCEVRDPDLNQRLHPDVNLCQECDYQGWVCREGKKRVDMTRPYADVLLVTTPDMRDFIPEAVHFPFFTPFIDYAKYTAAQHRRKDGASFKIVHVTNHPGLEGTASIRKVIEELNAKGLNVRFVFLKGVTPDAALSEYQDADLSIGKMKMGYYANAQIESMFLDVPAVTYVRPEFMTPELAESGLIICHLNDLERTLEYYLTHPDALGAKKKMARQSILRLHDNNQLASRLMNLYKGTPDPVHST